MGFDDKRLGLLLMVLSVLLLSSLIIMKFEFDKRNALLCDLVHYSPNITMEECPVHGFNSFMISWLLTLLFGLSVAILLIGVIVFKGESGEETVSIDLSVLDSDERVLVELLQASGGSSYQSDLVRKSGFSKVKVSRVLDRLIDKGLVDKKRRGMTNLVVLK